MTSNTNYSGGVNGTMNSISAVGDATALGVVNTSNTTESALYVSNFGSYYGATCDTYGPTTAGVRARNLATTGGGGSNFGAALEADGGLNNGINVNCSATGLYVYSGATGANFNCTTYGVVIATTASNSVGVSAEGNLYSGYFYGGSSSQFVVRSPAVFSGYLSKDGGGYMIDHPQFPETKLLNHCFVESPEMKNVYDGVATLDANGTAVITLPSYFQAANSDYRYQLTAVGAAMPNLHVSQKIAGNSFAVAGGVAGAEVSWQVTGVRADKWALANHPGVEIDKPADKQGLYLHPELHGASADKYYHPLPDFASKK